MHSDRAPATWAVCVPAKALDNAKSRLGRSVPDAVRRELALAMLGDVLSALSESPLVTALGVVCRDAEIAEVARALAADVIREPAWTSTRRDGHAPTDRADLAFRRAAALGLEWASGRSTHRAVLAADLPGATATEVSSALAAAQRVPRGFVVDADRRGTTFATFGPGAEPRTFFGAGSAELFAASGAVELGAPTDWPGLRRDVDELAHLDSLPTRGARLAALTAQGRLPGGGTPGATSAR